MFNSQINDTQLRNCEFIRRKSQGRHKCCLKMRLSSNALTVKVKSGFLCTRQRELPTDDSIDSHWKPYAKGKRLYDLRAQTNRCTTVQRAKKRTLLLVVIATNSTTITAELISRHFFFLTSKSSYSETLCRFWILVLTSGAPCKAYRLETF